MDIFHFPTVSALVASLNVQPDASYGVNAAQASPMQRRYFESSARELRRLWDAAELEVPAGVGASDVEALARRLVARHEALRLRHTPDGDVWHYAAHEEASIFTHRDLSTLPESERNAALRARAEEAGGSLGFGGDPLLSLTLLTCGEGQASRLLVVTHRLIADDASRRILLEELRDGLRQDGERHPPRPASPPVPFSLAVSQMGALARSPEVLGELSYWLSETRRRVRPLPRDYTEARAAAEAPVGVCEFELGADLAEAILSNAGRGSPRRPEATMLAALVLAFAKLTGARPILVDLPVDGREQMAENIDLSGAVGNFDSVFPFLLGLGGAEGEAALSAASEQLRAVPNGGLGYGLLRYMNDDYEAAAKLRELPQAEVWFAYRRTVAPTTPLSTDEGGDLGIVAPPYVIGPYLFAVEVLPGIVGELKIRWSYREDVYRRATVEALGRSFVAELGTLAEQCRRSGPEGYAPSDFRRVALDQQKLNSILEKVGLASDEKR